MTVNKLSWDHSVKVEIVESINEINARDWNHLVAADYPFLSHEFLHALENSGCVSPHTGWAPRHILIRKSTAQCWELIAAAPLYLKGHSWGEFIFDWNWAQGYHRNGLDYYPKLISQTPFTPLTSPKMLMAPSACSTKTRHLIARTAKELGNAAGASSIHWHFVTDVDAKSLESCSFSNRLSTFEYIWNNQEYRSMEDFLSTLSSRKRKKIRRERRSICDQGVSVAVVQGTELNESHWRLLDRFYQQTVDKYNSHKYLSFDFFRRIGETMPDNLVIFIAQANHTPIAGSFCLRGGKKLYGRYWGSLGVFRDLHFEVCYYAAIEYCIEQGLTEYNAGVQGEHKLNRGFLPRLANSSHCFFHPAFAQAIARYIEQESSQLRAYCAVLDQYSAYAKQPPTQP